MSEGVIEQLFQSVNAVMEEVMSRKTSEIIEESVPIRNEEEALRALDGALCFVTFSAEGMKAYHLSNNLPDNAQDPVKAKPEYGKFLIYRAKHGGGAIALGKPKEGISFTRKLGGLVYFYYQLRAWEGDELAFGRGDGSVEDDPPF